MTIFDFSPNMIFHDQSCESRCFFSVHEPFDDLVVQLQEVCSVFGVMVSGLRSRRRLDTSVQLLVLSFKCCVFDTIYCI